MTADSTPANPPSAGPTGAIPNPASPTVVAVHRALLREAREIGAGGALLGAVRVGSWGRGEWEAGEDLDVRVIYAMPARRLLGLHSYADENETLTMLFFDGVRHELDVVAFEILKVARLLLKGHDLTLEWLTGPDENVIFTTPAFDRLVALAKERSSRLAAGVTPALPAVTYQILSALVADARLEAHAPT